MRASNINSQRGYVLLLVILMFMSIGGVVLAGFTQQARDEFEVKRYEHNQRVLEQAKQALLMFAYNYPQSNNRGPGRLPCPDHDDDGLVDFPLDCDTVGRFPWGDPRLNIQQTLDASGETLWYAVSDAFDNEAAGVVNSDTLGSITLVDQSGGILYDGAAAGIAAVIIAPGPVVKRDEDANGTYEYTQERDDPGEQIDPRNYLDTFNGFDNSVFTNDESDTNDDGFILGPVYDNAENEIVVNDQIIIVTADEVIAMAEKAVLEAYRDAIDLYQQNLWAVPANYRYPWLHGYDDTTDLDIYNVNLLPGDTVGRVPFQNYFEDSDSLHVVVTDLQIDYDISLTYTSLLDNDQPGNENYIDVFNDLFANYPAGTQTVTIPGANLSFGKITFDGLDDVSDNGVGTLISQTGVTTGAPVYPVATLQRFFWDGDGGALPQDGWEVCDNGGGVATDCAVDGTGNFVPFAGGWNLHTNIRIRLVELELIVDPDFVIELDYDPTPTIAAPVAPTAGSNARFTATFNNWVDITMSVTNIIETSARNFIDLNVVICEQDNGVGTALNLATPGPFHSPPDGGTAPCTVDLVPNATYALNSAFSVTADYYPEIPLWVAENEWDDAVMMTYMSDFAPGPTTASCTPEDGNVGTGAADDCLVISNVGGVNNDISALLVLAGEHDLLDGDDLNDDGDYVDANEVVPDGNFLDELYDIFEPENYSGIGPYPTFPYVDPDPPSDTGWDLVFDKREDVIMDQNAADTVFILDRL